MKNRTKIFLSLFLFAVSMLFAQSTPPPVPPGGGTGGVGTGAQASPIDMYVYILAGIALIMMLYFVKRRRIQNI